MIKVAIEDLEKNIPFILQHIEAGDSFLIFKGQKPMGEFRPIHPRSLALRPYGLCAGDFIVPEGFNQSLPEDIIREYEGSIIIPAASSGVLDVIPCLTEPAPYLMRGNPVSFPGSPLSRE